MELSKENKNVVENVVEKSNEQKIIELIKDNSKVSKFTMSKVLKLSTRQVDRVITNMRKHKKIDRVGAAKGGYWIIL